MNAAWGQGGVEKSNADVFLPPLKICPKNLDFLTNCGVSRGEKLKSYKRNGRKTNPGPVHGGCLLTVSLDFNSST